MKIKQLYFSLSRDSLAIAPPNGHLQHVHGWRTREVVAPAQMLFVGAGSVAEEDGWVRPAFSSV